MDLEFRCNIIAVSLDENVGVWRQWEAAGVEYRRSDAGDYYYDNQQKKWRNVPPCNNVI